MATEFVPAVDTDKAAYETLANQDGDLLIRIKEGMARGVNASVVATWALWRFADGRTVKLVSGAARYIERCQAE